MGLVAVKVQCPHCWQYFEALVDGSQGDQEYVEDCHVCCQPLLLTVTLDDPEQPRVVARAENE